MGMRLIEELRAIVGEENATEDIAICTSYSRDQHWHFVPAKNPAYVVRPGSKEEVRQVLMLANKEKIPVIPYSTGINVRGLTIPVHDGSILLDLANESHHRGKSRDEDRYRGARCDIWDAV